MLFVDQFTKFLAVKYLKGGEQVPVLGDIFVLQYLENNGAAFGMLQGKKIFFILLTIVVVAAVTFVYLKIPHQKKYYPLNLTAILLIAGALGNFIDRLTHVYVVDFFYFQLIDFPVFNVADIYVTFAAIGLFICFLFLYSEEDLKEVLHS